jgi:hypothetical protein
MREDGCVMSWRLAHDAEASTSHAALPAPDVAVMRPKQGLQHADAPPTNFNEAQAEQALWLEFRDHGISINKALTEVLRIHGGPSIRRFEVSAFLSDSRLAPHLFCVWAFPDPAFLRILDCY